MDKRQRGHRWPLPIRAQVTAAFQQGFAARINGISLGKHGRHRTNLWTYPATSKIVFDPFLDSGSTLIAAQNTKRVCCGVTDHNASRQR
jgi:hypothetical protein